MDPAMREIIWVGFFLGAGVEAAKGMAVVELDMVARSCGPVVWGHAWGMGVVSNRYCHMTLVRMWRRVVGPRLILIDAYDHPHHQGGRERARTKKGHGVTLSDTHTRGPPWTDRSGSPLTLLGLGHEAMPGPTGRGASCVAQSRFLEAACVAGICLPSTHPPTQALVKQRALVKKDSRTTRQRSLGDASNSGR